MRTTICCAPAGSTGAPWAQHTSHVGNTLGSHETECRFNRCILPDGRPDMIQNVQNLQFGSKLPYLLLN